MRSLILAILIGCAAVGLLSANVAEAGAPMVSNVRAAQRSDTTLVDITYDVDDQDGDPLTVTVEVSDDEGMTYSILAVSFTGDVGPGVAVGTDRHIVWDAGNDVPDIYSVHFVVRVTADDGVGSAPPPGMTLITGGVFTMGTNLGESDESPEHQVSLSAFYIDLTEVTNRD